MQRSIWFVLEVQAERHSMEEQLVALAERLGLEDVAVTAVFASPPGAHLRETLEKLGVDVRTLQFRSARAAIILSLWFHEYRPDIVHFHFVDRYPGFVAAAKLSGASTLVDDTGFRRPSRTLRALVRRARGLVLDWLVDTRVACDAVSLARFAGGDGEAVRKELGVGPSPLVVSAGRLDEVEGGETLLRAMALLEPDVHLALAGEGHGELAWRTLAGELGIAGRVHFLGLRNDVEDILAAASVVVVPAESEEALGLAAIEGMAASRPVIVTRAGGMPAIVGDAGIVVPEQDPASLGLAIRTVLSDPEHGSRLGKLGRKRVEELYSMDAHVERLMKTYRRIFLRAEPRTAPSKILELL